MSMSDRDIKYYKKLAKKFKVKEKLFDEKEDFNELEGDKASLQRKQAEGKAEVQEQLLKIQKLRESGNEDKALKQEMKLKKKEATITKYKKNITDIQKKMDKKKLEVRKIEDNLEEIESQLRSDFADKFTQM